MRYDRQQTLLGAAAQQRVRQASVLIVGLGGLGCPAAQYLAGSGIGHLGLVDFDTVELSNLHRQPLHATSAIGRRKVHSAQLRLGELNPDTRVSVFAERFAPAHVRDFDVVIDATDNFSARYLINDVCVQQGKPLVHGSVFQYEGQVAVFHRNTCYRCLFPAAPATSQSCAEAGVLGVLPGVIGTLQATEALKLIAQIGEPLIDRVVTFDALTMAWRKLAISKSPHCPEHAMVNDLPSLSVHELKRLRDEGVPFLLVDVRENEEFATANLGGVLMKADQVNAPKGERIIVHCHKGGRSAKAVLRLRELGYTNVFNLTGGIDEWSREIDPSVPRY